MFYSNQFKSWDHFFKGFTDLAKNGHLFGHLAIGFVGTKQGPLTCETIHFRFTLLENQFWGYNQFMVGDRSIPGSLFRTECDAMFCCSYENLTKPENVDPCRLQKFIVYHGFVILCRVQNPRRVFPFTARNRAISFVQRTFASDAIGCHDRGLRERHAEKKSSQQYWMPLPSGWWFYPSWKISVNGKDDIPYVKWKIKIKNVWNHQPEYLHDKCWDDLILYFWGGSWKFLPENPLENWDTPLAVEFPRPQIKRSYKGMTKGREGSKERRR
jgi:hypothetical protein